MRWHLIMSLVNFHCVKRTQTGRSEEVFSGGKHVGHFEIENSRCIASGQSETGKASEGDGGGWKGQGSRCSVSPILNSRRATTVECRNFQANKWFPYKVALIVLAAHCRLPICLLDSGPRYRVNGVDKGTSLSPPHTFARKCSNSSSQSLLLLAVAWSATLKWPKIPNVTQKNKTKNKQYTMKYGVHFQHKASNISGLCESVGWSESDASKRFNSFESQIFLTLNL